MLNKLNRFFHIKENGSSLRTEVIAGITTFMTMAYLLMVNPGMLSELDSTMGFGGAYIATALAAFVGTMAMGLIANLPVGVAVGMGHNAFLIQTVCLGMGFTFANSLLFVLADGLIFLLLALTGLQKVILNAMPKAVMNAIPVGIGLFLAFVGLQEAGIVVKSQSTGVDLVSFNLLNGVTWAQIMPLLVTLATVIGIAVLQHKQVKGGMVLSILGGSVLYYLLGLTIPHFYDGFFGNLSLNPLSAFRDFGQAYVGRVFTEGLDFSHYLSAPNHSVAGLILSFVSGLLAFCLLDMFSTMGTLFGLCKSGNLLVQNTNGEQEMPRMKQALLADAVAIGASSMLGSSTATPLAENSSGIMAGGRTGMTAMVTGGLFLLATFLSPLAALIPAAAYSAVLIYLGVLMIGGVPDIDWKKVSSAFPAFFTIAMMPFTYNIAYGIAFGLITYTLFHLAVGEIKQVKISTWILTLLFTAMFLFTH